jgi:hypothetical protein
MTYSGSLFEHHWVSTSAIRWSNDVDRPWKLSFVDVHTQSLLRGSVIIWSSDARCYAFFQLQVEKDHATPKAMHSFSCK